MITPGFNVFAIYNYPGESVIADRIPDWPLNQNYNHKHLAYEVIMSTHTLCRPSKCRDFSSSLKILSTVSSSGALV